MSQPDYYLQLERARELVNRGELAEAEQMLAKVEKILNEPSTEKKIIADWFNEKGKIEFRRGDYEAAKNLLEIALSKSRECNYEYGVAYSLHYLGATAKNLGETDHAFELYEQALNIRRRIGDLQGVKASLHNIAMCQSQRGNVREALALYNEVIEIEKGLDDIVGMVRTLTNIGDTYRRMGDLSGALPYLKQAQELALQIDMKQGKALVDYNMGVVAWAQGKNDKAKQRLFDCINYWEGQGREDALLALALRDLAEIMAEMEQFDEADKSLAKLKQISQKHGSALISCFSSYSHGAVARAKGNAAAALGAFGECLTLSRKHKLFDLELKSLVQLAEMHLFEFRLTMDEEYLEKTRNLIMEAKTASRERNYGHVWVETSIVNGMLMAAAMDFHAAEAELTQAILSAQEENLPLQEKRAEDQLMKVKKLHVRANRLIKPPELEDQVEEIKSYLSKYANALKAFKT